LNVELGPNQEVLDFSALEIRTIKKRLISIASQDNIDEGEVLRFLEEKREEYATREGFPQNRKAVEVLLQQIEEGRVTTSDILGRVRLSEQETAGQESGLKKFFKGFLRR